MPVFVYEALKKDGSRTRGEIDAIDRTSAITEIRNAGMRPVKVAQRAGASAPGRAMQPAGQAAAAQHTVAAAPAKRGKTPRGRVSRQQVTDFSSQFAVLQDAGLPIVRSLRILAAQQKGGPFKAVIEDIADSVESGTSLSEAMQRHPKVFDRLYCNMIRAGEVGGALDVIFNRLATFLEKEQRLKRKIIGASIYPIVVMSVAVLILAAILIFVVPAFEAMFKQQGIDMPLPTKILLAVSGGAAGWPGLVLLGALVAFFFGFGAWGRTAGGRRAIDRLKLKIPIFGTIVRKATTSRFCRTLATLATSGVPILEALAICRNAINNMVLAEAIDQVTSSIKEGESIAGPLAKTDLFDDIVVNMIDVGEETGELDKMLIKVADTYDLEVDVAVETLLSVLEPILIVFLGVTIGFIVISLFLPMIAMIQSVK